MNRFHVTNLPLLQERETEMVSQESNIITKQFHLLSRKLWKQRQLSYQVILSLAGKCKGRLTLSMLRTSPTVPTPRRQRVPGQQGERKVHLWLQSSKKWYGYCRQCPQSLRFVPGKIKPRQLCMTSSQGRRKWGETRSQPATEASPKGWGLVKHFLEHKTLFSLGEDEEKRKLIK